MIHHGIVGWIPNTAQTDLVVAASLRRLGEITGNLDAANTRCWALISAAFAFMNGADRVAVAPVTREPSTDELANALRRLVQHQPSLTTIVMPGVSPVPAAVWDVWQARSPDAQTALLVDGPWHADQPPPGGVLVVVGDPVDVMPPGLPGPTRAPASTIANSALVAPDGLLGIAELPRTATTTADDPRPFALTLRMGRGRGRAPRIVANPAMSTEPNEPAPGPLALLNADLQEIAGESTSAATAIRRATARLRQAEMDGVIAGGPGGEPAFAIAKTAERQVSITVRPPARSPVGLTLNTKHTGH